MQFDPENFESAIATARAALECGDHADAAGRFAELARRYPKRPAGFLGLGQVAQARGDWQAAADTFTACIARFPQPNTADWRCSLAWSELQLGRPERALDALQPLLETGSMSRNQHALLASTFFELERWREAAAHWEHACAGGAEPPRAEWIMRYADTLVHLGRSGEAKIRLRASFIADPSSLFLVRRYLNLLGWQHDDRPMIDEAFDLLSADERADTRLACAALASRMNDIGRVQNFVDEALPRLALVSECARVFDLIPQAFEGWARTSRLIALEQRLDGVTDADSTQQAEQAYVLRMRIKLALRDHPAFLRLQGTNPDRSEPRRRRYARLAEILVRRPFPDHNAEKIFGVGLPKTGTTSLHVALGELGFLSAHYTNDFTGEVLTFEDYFLFEALTDEPACLLFESSLQIFPASRFIYTTRPLDDWIASLNRHHQRFLGTSDLPSLLASATGPSKFRYGSARAAFAVPLLYRHASAREARAAFETRLFDFFSGERRSRLLVLDLFSGDGWPQLCAFLGRDIPQTPFPRENVAVR